MPAIEFRNRDYIPVLVLPANGRRIPLTVCILVMLFSIKTNQTEIPPMQFENLHILFNSFLILEVVNSIAREVLVLHALLSSHFCWKYQASPSTSADTAIWFDRIIWRKAPSAEREGDLVR